MKKLLKDLFFFMIGILSYVVPKEKNLYAYLPIHDKNKFSGNIRALFLYSTINHPEITNVLITTNSKVYDEVKKMGYQVIHNQLKTVWCMLKAEHLIIDATTNTLFFGRFSIIQLWHGTGFKKVGLLNNNADKNDLKRFNKHYKKYGFVVANSESDSIRKNDTFGRGIALTTGSPRNDFFFSDKMQVGLIKEKYGISNFEKIITYAPTFRDFETTPPFTDGFWIKLNKQLKQSNSLFVVKKHPWDKYLNVPDNFSNIKDLSVLVADVQELLLISDMLISDYSSIMTDFAITNKSIIVYNYDYEQYEKTCREMYYDLEEVLPKPFVKDENDLLEKISDLSWTQEILAKESYASFRNKFHYFLDGNSSERVLAEIMNLNS